MKKTHEELNNEVEELRNRIPTTTYRHYKGGVYRVVDYVFDTEREDFSIIYVDADNPMNIVQFARPANMWFDDVQPEPGIFVPRFRKVSKVEVWADTDNKEIFPPSW